MRAWLNLRHNVSSRRDAFGAGLEKLGYRVIDGTTLTPDPGDVLVTWNRINIGNAAARAFEARGLPVLVVENASWGNDFLGRQWLTLGLGRHNTAGCFPVGGPERWDALGVTPEPWRDGGETVILPQRGIGADGMPHGWGERARAQYGGRIRQHPGMRACVPLEVDFVRAGRVVTWGSGAAIKALLLGIPVVSEMPGWIGEQDNTDAGRLAMFRRLAWAQWQLSEIADGSALRWMLSA